MTDTWRTLDPPLPYGPAPAVDFPAPLDIGYYVPPSVTKIRVECRDTGVAVFGWGYRDGVLTFEIGSRES